jgi:hypothetical protein
VFIEMLALTESNRNKCQASEGINAICDEP